MEVISSVLKLPKYLMEKGQQQHNSCSRLITAVELITTYSSLEFQNVFIFFYFFTNSILRFLLSYICSTVMSCILYLE